MSDHERKIAPGRKSKRERKESVWKAPKGVPTVSARVQRAGSFVAAAAMLGLGHQTPFRSHK